MLWKTKLKFFFLFYLLGSCQSSEKNVKKIHQKLASKLPKKSFSYLNEKSCNALLDYHWDKEKLACLLSYESKAMKKALKCHSKKDHYWDRYKCLSLKKIAKTQQKFWYIQKCYGKEKFLWNGYDCQPVKKQEEYDPLLEKGILIHKNYQVIEDPSYYGDKSIVVAFKSTYVFKPEDFGFHKSRKSYAKEAISILSMDKVLEPYLNFSKLKGSKIIGRKIKMSDLEKGALFIKYNQQAQKTFEFKFRYFHRKKSSMNDYLFSVSTDYPALIVYEKENFEGNTHILSLNKWFPIAENKASKKKSCSFKKNRKIFYGSALVPEGAEIELKVSYFAAPDPLGLSSFYCFNFKPDTWPVSELSKERTFSGGGAKGLKLGSELASLQQSLDNLPDTCWGRGGVWWAKAGDDMSKKFGWDKKESTYWCYWNLKWSIRAVLVES